MADSGVYSITNLVNGNKYIGSAVNISRRWREHKKMLSKNVHHSGYLQNAWNKYGAENFEFTVIEYCEADYLIRCEQFYIDCEKPAYNMSPTAGSNLGIKFSDAARANMGLARMGNTNGLGNTNMLGKHHTLETRERMSAAQMGHITTAETRRNIGKAKKGNTYCLGRIVSEEARLKMSGENNPMFGKHPSEETRRRMSEAHLRRHAAAQMQPVLETV